MDSEPERDTGDGPTEFDSQVCQDFLDCLAAVDPGALAEQEAEYGLSGACWESGDTERCESVCASLHDELYAENPREPACGEVSLCPPTDGRWTMYFGETPGGCYYDWETVVLSCEQEGDTWIMDINNGNGGERLFYCDGVGTSRAFTCRSSEYQATASGEFAEDYLSAIGSYEMSSGDSRCDGEGGWSLSEN